MEIDDKIEIARGRPGTVSGDHIYVDVLSSRSECDLSHGPKAAVKRAMDVNRVGPLDLLNLEAYSGGLDLAVVVEEQEQSKKQVTKEPHREGSEPSLRGFRRLRAYWQGRVHD